MSTSRFALQNAHALQNAQRSPDGPAFARDQTPITDDTIRRIIAAGLSKNERLILILYYQEKMTIKEISTALKIPVWEVAQAFSAIHADLLEKIAPVCKRGKQTSFSKNLIEEVRGGRRREPPPVETLEHVAYTARHLLGAWRPIIASLEKIQKNADERCVKAGCIYIAMLLSLEPPTIQTLINEQKRRDCLRAMTDNQKCPFCLRVLGLFILVDHLEDENANLIRAAARLLPEAYERLEVVHLADGFLHGPFDCVEFVLEDRMADAERDWNRLLKAAVLARERQEAHPGSAAPPATGPTGQGSAATEDCKVTLKEFMKERCESLPSESLLNSRLNWLWHAARRKTIELPPCQKPWPRGQKKVFSARALTQAWPGYLKIHPGLPRLK